MEASHSPFMGFGGKKMRRSPTFAIVALLLLCGCANPMQDMAAKLSTIQAECDAKLQSGFYKTYIERTECVNPQVQLAYTQVGYPYMDLVYLANAYRMALAQRVDAKEVSLTDAKLLMAELGTRIANEEQQRNSAAAYARAANSSSTAHLLQGLAAWNNSMQPTSAPGPVITCTQMGNVTQCY